MSSVSRLSSHKYPQNDDDDSDFTFVGKTISLTIKTQSKKNVKGGKFPCEGDRA